MSVTREPAAPISTMAEHLESRFLLKTRRVKLTTSVSRIISRFRYPNGLDVLTIGRRRGWRLQVGLTGYAIYWETTDPTRTTLESEWRLVVDNAQ